MVFVHPNHRKVTAHAHAWISTKDQAWQMALWLDLTRQATHELAAAAGLWAFGRMTTHADRDRRGRQRGPGEFVATMAVTLANMSRPQVLPGRPSAAITEEWHRIW